MLYIRQIIPEGFCLKCGGCCRFASDNPPWPPFGIRPIPNKKDNNFLCPYLNFADNKCKIYETRPFECGLYPFLINRDAGSGKVYLSVDLYCLFAKDNLRDEKFRNYIEYLSARLKNPDFLKIFKEDPQAIQSYPGVLNLSEIRL